MNDNQRTEIMQTLIRFHNECGKEGTIGHGLQCIGTAIGEIEAIMEPAINAELVMQVEHVLGRIANTVALHGLKALNYPQYEEMTKIEASRIVTMTRSALIDEVRKEMGV